MTLVDQHVVVHTNKTRVVQRVTEITIAGARIDVAPVELQPGDTLSIHVKRGGRRFTQYNAKEHSERHCPCGGSISWSGMPNESFYEWLDVHRPHVDSDAVDEVY